MKSCREKAGMKAKTKPQSKSETPPLEWRSKTLCAQHNSGQKNNNTTLILFSYSIYSLHYTYVTLSKSALDYYGYSDLNLLAEVTKLLT